MKKIPEGAEIKVSKRGSNYYEQNGHKYYIKSETKSVYDDPDWVTDPKKALDKINNLDNLQREDNLEQINKEINAKLNKIALQEKRIEKNGTLYIYDDMRCVQYSIWEIVQRLDEKRKKGHTNKLLLKKAFKVSREFDELVKMIEANYKINEEE